MQAHKNKKASWTEAIGTFLAPIALVFLLRWIVFEPYVIPSGSMIPTLLIHDHILVNKWVYGWRWPFSEKWLTFWNKPANGEIVIFKYPKSKDTYFVKRVVASEGDVIEVTEGQLKINDQFIKRENIDLSNLISDYRLAEPLIQSNLNNAIQFEDEKKIYNQIISNNYEILKQLRLDLSILPEIFSDSWKNFSYFRESIQNHHFISRSLGEGQLPNYQSFKVPIGHFFVVGDNRDESSDSRVWGVVPYENLMGRAWFIWLSCEETLVSNPMVCDPNKIRWNRLFKLIN